MFDLSPKAKTLVKKLPKILLYTFIIGIVAWFAAVRPALAYLEKKKFEAAYSELEIISKQIQQKIGQADEVNNNSSCDRANMKNTQGPLGCSSSITMRFMNKSPEQATEMMNSASDSFEGELRKGNYFGQEELMNHTYDFRVRKNGLTKQIYYQDMANISSLRCVATYKHDNSSNEPYFYMSLSCSGSAITEYYPRRN